MPDPEPTPRAQPPPHPQDFDAFFRHFAAVASRWARRLGGPQVDVEDVVQEVFATVLRTSKRYDASLGVPEAWLRGIVVRTVLNHRRRLARRRRLLWFAGDEREVLNPEPWPSPDAAAEHRQLGVRLLSALERLPETQRAAFVLFEMEGVSGSEVAALLGTSLSNTWVVIHRARRKLAELLEGHEP